MTEIYTPILKRAYQSFDLDDIKEIEHALDLAKFELGRAKEQKSESDWAAESPDGEYDARAQHHEFTSLSKLENAATLAVQASIMLKAFVNRSKA